MLILNLYANYAYANYANYMIIMRDTITFRAQLRTTQLQAYWKRICEEEKRSQQRNEQILSTIDRIDSYTAMLEEKTEKLRQMKVF